MILIFMLAFMIAVLFVVQLVGFKVLTDRQARAAEGKPPGPGPPPPADRYARSPSPPGSAGRAPPWSPGRSAGYPTAPSLLPTSPDLTARFGGLAAPAPHDHAANDSPVGGMVVLKVEAGEAATAGPGREDAICAALILPHGKAQFVIPTEAIRRLSAGQHPVEILGPSGRPLLHARLPLAAEGGLGLGPQPGGDGAGGSPQACWLELTTTPKSRYPHASIGPLVLGRMLREGLQIRGPRSERYGSLEVDASGLWRAQRDGRTILTIGAARGRGSPGAGSIPTFGGGDGSALAASGSALATDGGTAVATVALAGADGQALEVKVCPDVDALLTLLCSLAVVLMVPEHLQVAGTPD